MRGTKNELGPMWHALMQLEDVGAFRFGDIEEKTVEKSKAKKEVTIPVTLTRSEWCEVVNAVGTRGNVLLREYDESNARMDPGECTCGAYDGIPEEDYEDIDVSCVCYKTWADELRSAFSKLAALCDENGVKY